MKRVVLPLLSLALGPLLLGAVRKPDKTHTPPAPAPVRYADLSAGSIAHVLKVVVTAAHSDDGEDRAAARAKLKRDEAGTYIDDILRERDSAIARWPDRAADPLTVWIQPTSAVRDFLPEYVARVRSAFEDWDGLRLPVRFAFVPDSADAEVHVRWIDHFNEPISGRTRWTRDDTWEITDANIVLAVHHQQGEQLDPESMRAMALHEIGHLLGLDHTRDSLSIMAPKVRVRELSSADRATARLVYALPIGSLR